MFTINLEDASGGQTPSPEGTNSMRRDDVRVGRHRVS